MLAGAPVLLFVLVFAGLWWMQAMTKPHAQGVGTSA